MKAVSARHPYRRRRQHARQAKPGVAPRPQDLVDVACDRRGQERRGRCRGIRRQYRRADGDGPVLPAHAARHRPPGARGGVADGARRFRRARPRRHNRRRRASSGGAGGDGQRHGKRLVRPGTADRRPAQYRGRGDQGPRGNSRGRGTAARDEPAAARIYRVRRRRRHWQGRRRRHCRRRFQRQYRPEGRRGHGAADQRISARARCRHAGVRRIGYLFAQECVQGAARQAGSQQVQWQRAARPERHRGQEPRRNRRRRLCLCRRCWL